MLLMLLKILLIALTILVLWLKYKLNRLKSYTFDFLKKHIPLEEFSFNSVKLTTEDGYIIQLVNLRHKQNFKEELKPVIIQHGLGVSCATWIITGKENSPALILAAQGYDQQIQIFNLNSKV